MKTEIKRLIESQTKLEEELLSIKNEWQKVADAFVNRPYISDFLRIHSGIKTMPNDIKLRYDTEATFGAIDAALSYLKHKKV